MKKTVIYFIMLISLLIIPFNIFTPINKAYSENENTYLRIINEQTAFYKTQNADDILFYLPYTYYVKIIEQAGDFYHIEYSNQNSAIIDGYVLSGEMYSDGLSVTSPYPDLKIITAENTTMYSDKTLNTPLQYIFENRTLNYLGKNVSPNGENIYYIEYNNKLGFVKESNIVPFALVNHCNPLTFLEQTNTPEQKEKLPEISIEKTSSLRIIIIVCLASGGFIALFIALSEKPNRKKTENYFDENF